jgi:hypothetical protein
MSILTGLTTGIYKYIAIAGIGLGLAVGGYFYGLHNGKLESKVAISNFTASKDTELNDLNSIETHTVYQIITQYVTKIVHIKDVGDINDQIIAKNVPDHEFLSNGWVRSHDAAAAGESIDATTAANDSTTTITAVDALRTINQNYTSCNQYREQIIGLQGYINGYNSAVNKVNEDAKKKSK